ncbi:MAG: hypothetical protein BGN96_07835 [Bacteroidales bacterium 45-6]|nr:MAG: hypothetical protein BGN96_07835 [Bacteroidales bacterium 45-6]
MTDLSCSAETNDAQNSKKTKVQYFVNKQHTSIQRKGHSGLDAALIEEINIRVFLLKFAFRTP